jgi:FKBP-type peptidyl-prolyl cis-trans isomerase
MYRSRIMLVFALIATLIVVCSIVSNAVELRIPEHFHEQDEEHDDFLLVNTIFEPESCHEDHSRKTKIGDRILVHYEGKIHESTVAGAVGTVFDKSKPNQPFAFRIGGGEVIRGWEEG